MSPSLAACIRAARISDSEFHNARRAGRFDHWPDELSRDFAVRLGLYGALRVEGFSGAAAAAMAEDLARSPPQVRCFAPFEGKEGRELRDYSGVLWGKSLSEVATMLAEDKGRSVIGDGPPDPVLDAKPQAAVFSVINVPFIVRTMEELFQ